MSEALFDVFSEFATDEKLEVEGTWRDLGKGGRLLIARANNDRYNEMFKKLYDRWQEVLAVGDAAADEKSKEIMIEVMAQTVLVGWEGLAWKGQKVPYSVAVAKEMLQVKDFRNRVNAFSNDFSAYKLQQEVQAGNA